MIWWSWYDFLLFLVRLNGSINKGMWKPGWPSVIGTHHLCTYMMHDLVQMNLLPLERLHCIFKHHWNNCRSLLHVGSTFSFGGWLPSPNYYFALYFSGTLGASKDYEVQSCIWFSYICWCQGTYWILVSWHTPVSGKWVRSCTWILIFDILWEIHRLYFYFYLCLWYKNILLRIYFSIVIHNTQMVI